MVSEVPEYGYEIVHTYPHDRAAFTEGLFYWNGLPYESTGLEGESYVRKVKLETGEVLQQYTLPADIFGERIVNWKDKLVQLTYKTQLGFVYDLKTCGRGVVADHGPQGDLYGRRALARVESQSGTRGPPMLRRTFALNFLVALIRWPIAAQPAPIGRMKPGDIDGNDLGMNRNRR